MILDFIYSLNKDHQHQVTVANVMDVVSRLPGCAGQAADAANAYTQAKMEDDSETRKRRPKQGELCLSRSDESIFLRYDKFLHRIESIRIKMRKPDSRLSIEPSSFAQRSILKCV